MPWPLRFWPNGRVALPRNSGGGFLLPKQSSALQGFSLHPLFGIASAVSRRLLSLATSVSSNSPNCVTAGDTPSDSVREAGGLLLGSLCQAYSRRVEASKQLEQTGLIFRTKSGYVRQSPLLGIVNTCIDQMNRLSRELGLTPSARTRVQMVDEPKGSTRFTERRQVVLRPPKTGG